MPTIKCFMIEPTDRVRRWLRRYRWSSDEKKCPAPGNYGYHNARVPIEDGPCIDGANTSWSTEPADWPHDDPRWPTHCACGYEFAPDDQWQLFYHRIYRRTDTGEECTLDDAPAGAMWYADWLKQSEDQVYEGPGKFVGPDGHCLCVMTPAREWIADGPASNGDGWTRTGTPPNVTANPSIGQQDNNGGWLYHGWLRDGNLVDA